MLICFVENVHDMGDAVIICLIHSSKCPSKIDNKSDVNIKFKHTLQKGLNKGLMYRIYIYINLNVNICLYVTRMIIVIIRKYKK